MYIFEGLEGSWYIALCVCSSAKKLKVAVFTSFTKSQCCTGYLLIQVGIVSVCKSHYSVLAGLPKLSVDFSLFLECGRSWTISSVAAGAGPSAVGAGAGPSAISAVSAFSTFSSFLSAKYRIRHRRSILCCHEDIVW